MFEIQGSFIWGLCLGIEAPDAAAVDEDMAWVIMVDLFVYRLCFIKWKSAE
jgi:hypothetical protein